MLVDNESGGLHPELAFFFLDNQAHPKKKKRKTKIKVRKYI